MGYAAMQERAGSTTEPLSEQSIAHSAEDKAVMALFARGFTYDEVRAHCKRLGIKSDQNRWPMLRAVALGGE